MIEWAKEDMAEFREYLQQQHEYRMSSKEAAREYLTQIGILTPDGQFVGWFKELYSLNNNNDVRY